MKSKMKHRVNMTIPEGWNMQTDWVVWLRENFGIGRATWAATKEKIDDKYQFRVISNSKIRLITLFFKNKEDAMLFKLTWYGK